MSTFHPPPTTAAAGTRHRRLQVLRDRFIAANLRSRSLRLVKATRSGAFDLGRLHDVAPAALASLVAALGRSSLSVVVADHQADGAAAQAVADDLAGLAAAARLDEQLTGACDLAVGWPVLEGLGADGTWLRGPLLLYAATLSTTVTGKRQWRLQVDAEPLLNAPLAQAIDRASGVRVDLDTLRGADDDGHFAVDDATFAGLATTLRGLGIAIDAVAAGMMLDDGAPVPLQPRPSSARVGLPAGFRLGHTLMLGRFPRSGSTIAADYDALLASSLSDADLGAAAELLAIDDDVSAGNAVMETPSASSARSFSSSSAGTDLLGSRSLQVLPSDKSQDAVFAFLDHDVDTALVVQGPPGTGKSQLLANLVVAAAGQGQRVLVVCQKRAALDVVFDRLAHCGFGQPLALVHDVEHDRPRVTAAIAAVLEPVLQATVASPQAAPTLSSSWSVAQQERGHRLQAVQQAWRTLMVSPVAGRPPLAVLQETGIADDWSGPLAVDLVDVVDDELTQALLVAQQTRLETVWPTAARWACPHPLSLRGDWRFLSSSSHALALTTLAAAAVAATAVHAFQGPVTVAESLVVASAIDDAEAVLGVLAAGGPGHDALLVFWGWTGGATAGGVWSTATQRLQRARRDLVPVSLSLFSTTTAQLERWSSQLDDLERLQAHAWRVLLPRFWRLRRTMSDVFAVAVDGTGAALMPADVTGPSAIKTARAVVQQARDWHALLADLPDHDVLALGIDGSMASVDLALSSLRERHDHVAALHRLHTAVGGLSRAKALQQPLDLGACAGPPHGDDVTGADFVAAALAARRALALQRAASAALQAAAPLLDDRAARRWHEALVVGDASWSPALTALASAGLDGDGRASAAPSSAAFAVAAIDAELARDTKALRAALQRLPSSLTTEAAVVQFRRAVEAAWVSRCLDGRDPAVVEGPLVDEGSLQRLRRVHSACQQTAGALATDVVTGRLSALAASPQGGRQLKKLLAEVKKKRRQPTLRSLSEDFWEHGLSQALPVWLCSPESAASLFPPTAGLFDLVIFDEASQCPVEAAIPALVRARRAIVAGDDQQMPPSHFFQASAREDDGDDEEDSVVLASQSVLDLCRTAWPHLTLAWHYRSRDERLIAFSNAAFYGGKLTTAPRAGTRGGAADDDKASDGLHFTRVQGCWHHQQNHVEASAVVDLMVSLLCQPSPPSIGVVAFNQKHSELIETLLQQRLDVDDGFLRAWQADARRPSVEQYFIRNLENVQGDERDVIIVSPAYGPNERGVLHARFGPLGQQGGDKRLNVAITRARRGLHVLCSFNPADLDVEQATWPGPRLFKTWLQAVQAAASGDDDGLDRALTLAARLGGGHGVVDVVGGGSGASASPAIGGIVIEQLASALVERGCRVQRALGLGRQRLDLAVGVVGGPLTVGVDVSSFLSEHDALARDVYTPAFWARAGWRVLRVTPRAWATEADKVIAAVLAAVQGR